MMKVVMAIELTTVDAAEEADTNVLPYSNHK